MRDFQRHGCWCIGEVIFRAARVHFSRALRAFRWSLLNCQRLLSGGRNPCGVAALLFFGGFARVFVLLVSRFCLVSRCLWSFWFGWLGFWCFSFGARGCFRPCLFSGGAGGCRSLVLLPAALSLWSSAFWWGVVGPGRSAPSCWGSGLVDFGELSRVVVLGVRPLLFFVLSLLRFLS
ncbi:hypothetical protein SAMN06272755_3115 [Picosynechococcus sp. OG1]|nr:hypothetical protein SAMN06272755_3115 [Picosynechococcus sp. OG1]SMQ86497.1 hypothetical protein SAMN06272774_3247 [Synechococcus sp. 7002]